MQIQIHFGDILQPDGDEGKLIFRYGRSAPGSRRREDHGHGHVDNSLLQLLRSPVQFSLDLAFQPLELFLPGLKIRDIDQVSIADLLQLRAYIRRQVYDDLALLNGYRPVLGQLPGNLLQVDAVFFQQLRIRLNGQPAFFIYFHARREILEVYFAHWYLHAIAGRQRLREHAVQIYIHRSPDELF